MSIGAKEHDAIRAVVTEAIQNGQADTITKKMVVKAVLSRLGLPGDHFDKEQRNTVASAAKEVLDDYDAAEAKKASSPVKARSPAKRPPSTSPSKSEAVPSSPPVAREKLKTTKSKPVISDSEEGSDTPKKTKTLPQKKAQNTSTSKEVQTQKSRKRKSQDAFRTSEFINSEGDPISASQAGVVYSEASSSEDQPKKKSKNSSKKDEKSTKPAPAKKAAPRKSGANDDPDESELKKLKAFMVACEARQIWGKLFNKMGLDDTKSQIRYLRQQLKELGMPSRMSMEAAKKIGARRALEKEARELGIELDDVETPENPNEASEGEEKKSLRTAARPKRAAALKRPPPKQRIRIDSEGDLEEEASQDGDSDSESEESDSEGASENGEDDASSSSASSSEAATDGEDDEDGKPSKKKRSKQAIKSMKSKKSKKAVESSSGTDEDEADSDE